MAYKSFEDLEVWQRGCRLSVDIFNSFAECKNFTLKDQIGRASLSIPCNIAEGSERGSGRDFAHFLNFSKGSCGELRTQIYIARKLEVTGQIKLRTLRQRDQRDFEDAWKDCVAPFWRKADRNQSGLTAENLKLNT
jgi:four helix bundle protein